MILLQYCSDFGQCISLRKSSIIVSPNMAAEWIGYLEELFNI